MTINFMLHHLCSINELAVGEIKTFEIVGKKIALARVGEHEFHAIDDTCTHDECSLGEGFLDEQTISCPCHGAQFDVTSGRVLTLPAVRDVAGYHVETKEDGVFVEI